MKITFESTSKVITLKTPTGEVPARIWEGVTESGVKCHAYVTRIAVHNDEDSSQFEKELQEHKAPSVEIQAIPLHLIL
jgi:hypothetical protein